MSMISRLLKGRVGHEAPKAGRHAASPRLEMLESRTLLATTYTVTNTSAFENVPNSLPWAVANANYTTPGLDFINFNIPGPGVHAIILNDTLYVNDQVVINGASQPSYNGRPLVYVQGGRTAQGGPVNGIFNLVRKADSTSSGTTIQGLGMFEFNASGVTVNETSAYNWIQNNWIGFFSDGTNPPVLTTVRYNPGNGHYPIGVSMQSSNNAVRGNTVSGVYNGIALGEAEGPRRFTVDYVSNSVQGNNVGTNPAGSTDANYGNLSDGIFLGGGARRNFIGPDNVTSGNASAGIELLHPTVTGNVIFRNLVGTDRSGNVGIPNREVGIILANGANGNTIGGPFGGNIVSGNVLGGIVLGTTAFPVASSNWVQNNIVGLNGSQTGGVGRPQNWGITIESGSSYNVVEKNVTAGNDEHGIVIAGLRPVPNGPVTLLSQGNNVSDNWIGQSSNLTWFENGANGIALLPGASYNFIRRNGFGLNRFGPFYIAPGAVGNSIG